MEKIWEVAPRKFDDLIDQLLYNRGLFGDEVDEKIKDEFFKPDFSKHLHDPFLMKDLKKAAERILKAKEAGEKVGIYSDYDADGVPAAALLFRALSKIGITSYVFIPNREKGYGLSKEGIDYLIEKGCTLIITADLGIRNVVEADYCREKNISLIITDHHLPGEILPKSDLLINPKQPGDNYPYKELCGCGVAFKLISGLSKVCSEIDEKFLKWNLDLVSISTISDVVPLTGENRVLANYGLVVLNKTKNLGLLKLIKVSNLEDKKLTAYHVGFQLGPRINAPGRIDHATKSFELLVAEDESEATQLANWLNEKNEERQLSMDQAEEESIKKIEKDGLANGNILVVAGDWAKGIIGPTASRLVEKYCRPTILFSEGPEIFTGSARSIGGINIVEILDEAKDLILRYGGHKGAAGVSVNADNFNDFVKKVLKIAQKIPKEQLVKKIKIDAKVELKDLSEGLYENIIYFEPFGMGNSKPIFMTENIELDYSKLVGKEEKHLSFSANDGKMRIKSICFNVADECKMAESGNKYDIAYSLDINEWNGRRDLNLNVVDIRKSKQASK